MSSETWLKADNIAHKFFCKLALLVYNARSSTIVSHKSDKWFNLETPDTDIFKDHLRIYRTISTLAPPIPPFELQVLLVVPDLATDQVLVLTDPSSARRTHVKPTPSHVLLESWVVIFSPSSSRVPPGSSASTSSISSSEEVALSSVYKQSITLFRSLFTLLRILPAFKLAKRIKRAPDSSQLSIQVRVHTQPSPQPFRSESILKFGDTISPPSPIPSPSPMPTRTQVPPRQSPLPNTYTTNIPQQSFSNTSSPPVPSTVLPTNTYTFPAVSHPLGALSIAVTYLQSPTFHIDTLESLLSSRFLSQSRDDDSFVPTFAARQAQAQSGSLRSMGGFMPSGSSGAGAILSKSPPRPVPPSLKQAAGTATGTGFGSPSLVDRFILPPGGSVSSARSTSSRPVSLLSSGSAGSGHGETVAGAMLPSSIQAAGSTMNAGASAVPIKRPSISIINPFKSPTLSSAPHSLHSQYSPHSIHSQYSIHSSGGGVVGVGAGVGGGQPAIEQGPTLPSRPPSTLSSQQQQQQQQQHPFPSITPQVPPSPSLRHTSGGSLSGLGLGLGMGISSSPAGAGVVGVVGTVDSSPASVSSQTSVGPRKYVSSFSHRRQSSTLASASERSGVVEKVESNTDVVVPVPSTSSLTGGLVRAPSVSGHHIKETSGSSASTTTNFPPNAASSFEPPLQEAEEDELSAFVQAIDERVPLGSVRSRLGRGAHPLREGSTGDGTDVQKGKSEKPSGRRESLTEFASSSAAASSSSSPRHLNRIQTRADMMLTSRQSSSPSPVQTQQAQLPPPPSSSRNSPLTRLSSAAIDAELNRMRNEFNASLSTLNILTGNVGVGGSGAGAGASLIRRRTASGVSSSRGSGSPSPVHSGASPLPLAGALGLARRVSLAGGSPTGSVGSSSHSGSGLGFVGLSQGQGQGQGQGSGTGSPLARSPPRGGYRPSYPPPLQPPSSSSPSGAVNVTGSSSPVGSAGTSPLTSLRAPNPYIYQYSTPQSHQHSHSHSHSEARQPHRGSPLRAAIPLDESSSSSPSATGRGVDGDNDSGSGELGSEYGLGIGIVGLGNVGAGSGGGAGVGRGVNFGSSPTSRIGAASRHQQGGNGGNSSDGGLMRRILTGANASDEVIGRLEVDEVGTLGGGGGGGGGGRAAINARDEYAIRNRGLGDHQAIYPFPGSGFGSDSGVESDLNDADKAGKRGNGYRMY